MRTRSWLVLILAIGTIAIAIGIVLGLHDVIANQFNISPTLIDAFEEFIRQYTAGLPRPPVIP